METETSLSPLLSCPAPALEQGFMPLWEIGQAIPRPDEDPYARCWLHLLFGTEMEAHSRLIAAIPRAKKEETRRGLALISRAEAFQQASLAKHREPSFSICGDALIYSLLTIDLCAVLAQRAAPGRMRDALQFLQPEMTDELYRLSNLMMLLEKEQAQQVIASFEEILPGRPCIAAHRHPYDCVVSPLASESPLEALSPLLMLSALKVKQASWLAAAGKIQDPLAKDLFAELSLLSDGQITLFSSLLPGGTPLQQAYAFQYAEVYLYHSLGQDQENGSFRQFLMEQRDLEISHLQKLHRLIQEEESVFLPCPDLPLPLKLGPNKGYIRDMMHQVGLTWMRDGPAPVSALAPGADYFRYQKKTTRSEEKVPSHQVVKQMIEQFGADYRFEIAPHPLEALRSRTEDNTLAGR